MIPYPFPTSRDAIRFRASLGSSVRAGFLVIVLVMVSASVVRAADRLPSIVAYDGRITFVDRRQIVATITVTAEPLTSGEMLRHTFIRFEGQQISDLEVLTATGRPIEYDYRINGRTLQIAFVPVVEEAGDMPFRYVIRYRVEAASVESVRIPLPVPLLTTRPGEQSVHLALDLPEGDARVGDSFPPLTWSNSRHGSLRLATVPSFIRISRKPAEAVTWKDHILTATILNDGLILALLVLGTGLWKVRFAFRRE